MDLTSLYVRSSSGKLVPLSAVTTIGRATPARSPCSTSASFPRSRFPSTLRPACSLGDAIPRIEEAVKGEIPATISTGFQGTAQAFQSSLKGLGLLLIMAVLVIYLVLGILYESFIHPITILSGLPSAGFGALIALLAFGMELNVYGFVGILMLIGIVKKNAIMMIDFALEAQRKEGKPPAEAIYEACLVRFRPIMMTTHGRAHGHAAHRARHRRGRGVAATARHRRGRRPARLATAHALHHAGDLHLPGAAAESAEAGSIRPPRRSRAEGSGKTLRPKRWLTRPAPTNFHPGARGIGIFSRREPAGSLGTTGPQRGGSYGRHKTGSL